MKPGLPFLAPSSSRGWGHTRPCPPGVGSARSRSPLTCSTRERDPSPRDLRWPSPKAPRWDDLSGGVRGNLRHGPPPAVCTDTRGGGGAGQPSPQLPRGAGLLWGPAVPRGAPRQTGPVPPALRQELEPSCTWRSGGKADVEASAAHQQAPLFVPWTRRHGCSVLAEYTGNSTFRCIGVLRNMFNVMVLGNLEI